jgi:uncharacterized protein (UPF0261 family)
VNDAPRSVAILATLDTKGAEVGFVRGIVESLGARAVVVDTGILGEPTVPAEVSRQEVAAAAGTTLADLLAAGDKGGAIAAMARGATEVARRLHAEGRLHGVLGLGGAQGTGIGTAAMRALPLGVPKLMVSTVASGGATFGTFVGTSDVAMMHSVADVAGLNAVSRTVLSQAAGGIVGMVNAVLPPTTSGRTTIGLTMIGITTAGATEIRRRLEEQGHEVITFHGNGVGPKAMEDLVDAGVLHAVVDLSPHDVTDLLFGGIMPAHPGRFGAPVRRNVPLVVAPGGTDILLRGAYESVSADDRARKHVIHNAFHTHLRATAAEMRAVGRFVGERLAPAAATSAVYVPLRGYSQLNNAAGPLHDPEADRAFVAGVREAASELRVMELDAHVNDLTFAAAVAEGILAWLPSVARA